MITGVNRIDLEGKMLTLKCWSSKRFTSIKTHVGVLCEERSNKEKRNHYLRELSEQVLDLAVSKPIEDLKEFVKSQFAKSDKRIGILYRRHSTKRNTSPASVEKPQFHQTTLI